MGRVIHEIEKGLRISKENSDTEFFDVIFGSGAPGGDAGEQDAAPIGSLYVRQNGTGSKIYQKIANAAATSDWKEQAPNVQLGTFRPEKVRAVTSENVGNGVRDLTASPFTDDEGTTLDASDFAVGEFIIDNSLAAPVLREVTAVSSPNVTFSTPDPNLNPVLAENDTFITPNYLPDTPDDQEGQAIVQFNGTIMAKVGDVNWAFADGINLLASITDRNGPVAASDTVQVAIEKLEGDAKDSHTAIGIARGDVNMGTFSSPASLLLAASQTIKQLFQRVGDLLAQLRGVNVTGVTGGAGGRATIDEIVVDDVKSCVWLVHAFEEANPARVKSWYVSALHDGTASADATQTDDTVTDKLKIGTNFDANLTVDLNGAGAAQRLRLRGDSTTAGVTFTARRIEVLKTVL